MNWIGEEQLLQLTGYKSRGWLARTLAKQGIRYITGKGGRIAVPESAIQNLVEDTEPDAVQFL